MSKILSPISGQPALKLKSINHNQLINDYSTNLKIDISKFLFNKGDIALYECAQTSYKFFHPYNIDGDSQFYEDLQKFEWYYMPWKWEHEYTLGLLQSSDKILEVGSGGLGFIDVIHNKKYDITGLELNKDSIIKAREKGLNVLNYSIEEFALKNEGVFDVVCSYQVMEHISDVKSFITSKIKCLKPGGKLIICIPNNDSFIKYSEGGILNFPPHHMGWWTRKSLEEITNFFDIKLKSINYEPLQKYHYRWYSSIIEEKYFKTGVGRLIYKKMKLDRLLKKYASLRADKINGHSILATYIKI